jgi:hypothetical protein
VAFSADDRLLAVGGATEVIDLESFSNAQQLRPSFSVGFGEVEGRTILITDNYLLWDLSDRVR